MERNDCKIIFSWVKVHVGIFDNELADRLAKEMARRVHTSYEFDRIPKNTLYHEALEESHTKMTSPMDNMPQGGCNGTVFPICTGQAKDKNQLNPKVSRSAYRAR